MVPRRQPRDEGGDLSGVGIDDHDAGAVVLPGPPNGLIRVGGEEPPAFAALLEGDIDRGTRWLEAAAGLCGLAERPTEQRSVLIEHQDVGCEGVGRRELPPDDGTRIVVTPARQTVARLQHEHLETLGVTAEGDPGRAVQSGLEH